MVTMKILLVECFLAAPCCDDHTVLAIMLMPICIISVQVWYTSLMCSTLAVKNLTWAWALRTSWPVHVPIIRQMVYMGTCSNKLKKRTKSRRDINILELLFFWSFIFIPFASYMNGHPLCPKQNSRYHRKKSIYSALVFFKVA
jgi:hypothetical protein